MRRFIQNQPWRHAPNRRAADFCQKKSQFQHLLWPNRLSAEPRRNVHLRN